MAMKINLSPNKALVISIALLLVVNGGAILYYSNRLLQQNEQFSAKVSSLGNELNENIRELKAQLSSIEDNLTTEINLVDTNLRNFKSKNQQEINALNNLIDEIEKQSEIQLGELKDELKSIQVSSKDFTAIIDDVLNSVVSITTDKSQGSGIIIESEGFIATNYHVVDDANIIRVATYGGKAYDAQLIGYNGLVDIAVLKVDAELPSLQFSNSDNVKVGEKVIALGNPAGLSFTVTEGIISAIHRKGPNDLNIYLQTDVPINPGNSGGPLVNANSQILGINNFKVGGFESLGFAIESNTVKQVAEQIINAYREKKG